MTQKLYFLELKSYVEYYIMLHYITVILYYATLHYITYCYVMLIVYYIIYVKVRGIGKRWLTTLSVFMYLVILRKTTKTAKQNRRHQPCLR